MLEELVLDCADLMSKRNFDPPLAKNELRQQPMYPPPDTVDK